ncbi:hypothetical protein G7K_1414-t1 [Saitoella complicata NRRL Y-17804]|uniref:Uncharacterized protein n=1 Tax=Saitoella complicata (strain BCRC 22490 / CBS 7301 / JCM 7358 / NBRC 10748 / NRRL Y-17804) TaxID=698492 RepID=A0A0E9NBJ1_SAICN|nr:hypothetical protein G7K_1414-t1 [Saitoella complicata NRRL Y-17804]
MRDSHRRIDGSFPGLTPECLSRTIAIGNQSTELNSASRSAHKPTPGLVWPRPNRRKTPEGYRPPGDACVEETRSHGPLFLTPNNHPC